MKVLNILGKEEKTVTLPKQFNEDLRIDLIQKTVRVYNQNKRQPYGSDPFAGMKTSAKISRRRRDYKGSYGIGISRVPRKIMSHRGTRFNWLAAFAPGTVKGRKAHPPKAYKDWSLSMNVKERKKAIRSALGATLNKELVELRGHKVPPSYPFIVVNALEALSKTQEVIATLESLGLHNELIRCSVKKVRAGKGTMRGNRYKKTKGPLIVVDKECPLMDAAHNIPGIEVVPVQFVNVNLLAPGAHAGRLTLFTEKAIARIESEGLFL